MSEDSISTGLFANVGSRGLHRGQLAVVGPLIAITISELALYYDHLEITLYGHLLTLLACVFGPLWLTGETRVLRAFALVPLLRLVNLGMPVFFPRTLGWFPFIYGPLLPALYLLTSGDEQLEIQPDFQTVIVLLPVIIPITVGMSQLEYAVIRPEALIPTWEPLQIAFLAVVMIGFVGLVEEWLFRGILQQTLQDRLGQWIGIGLASVLFGLMHSGYGSSLEILLASGIGLVFGLLYHYTESLATVTLMHGLLNVFLFGALPMGHFVFKLV